LKTQEPYYSPEWRSAEEIANWLGVNVNTLFKWRTTKGLAWTNLDGKTVCYDKRQINKMLNDNSTYAIIGDKKLSA